MHVLGANFGGTKGKIQGSQHSDGPFAIASFLDLDAL